MEILLDNLLEEFDIAANSDKKEDIKSEPMQLDSVDINNPDAILSKNISKANALLDHILKEITDGNFSPRIAEVASMIIGNVTDSTSQIYSNKFNEQNIDIKYKQLQLKERMLEKISGAKGSVSNTNIVVTDRESLLKFLKSEDEIKRIESQNIIDIGD